MRPMLAAEAPEDLTKLVYPVLGSAKLDGIRCLIKGGEAVSRTLKPIPNAYVQECLQDFPEGCDGELIVGSPTDSEVYRRTMSGVMSMKGNPDFTYYIFDKWDDIFSTEYVDRVQCMYDRLKHIPNNLGFRFEILNQTYLSNADQVLEYEKEVLSRGFEGIILRKPNKSPYKFGRSTVKEQYLLKVKRFKDGEAVIVEFEELMHNGNEAEIDNLGLTTRSSHISNLVPIGVLGALVVKDLTTGVVFKLGTGYNSYHRDYIWRHRNALKGAVVKYKFFEIGIKDAPRHPVWIGFRHTSDLGE